MGYVPAPAPIRLNVDKFGMPKDYATYMWITYRRIVSDDSPVRRAFLHGPFADIGDFGQQIAWR